MIRSGLRWLALASLGLAVVPGGSSAQFGGMGGGMMAMPAGGQEPQETWERMAEVESATGKRVTGPLRLAAIAIDSEFGRYEIPPEKLGAIRFDVPEGHPPMSMIVHGGVQYVTVLGEVVALSGEEIVGTLNLSSPLKMTTELGPLTLDPFKIRSITFFPEDPAEEDADEEAEPLELGASTPAEDGPEAAGFGRRINAPEPMKINDLVWAIAPSGNRIAVRDVKSGKTARVDLPASDESPLLVSPLNLGFLMALHLEGPEIRKLAVFNPNNLTWYPIDLCEPVSGKASPIVNFGIAVYPLGRHVYAFSIHSNRWGALELSAEASAAPVLGSDGTVTVRDGHRIHTFQGETGEWTTVDSRELLSDLLGDDVPEGEDTVRDDDESPESPGSP